MGGRAKPRGGGLGSQWKVKAGRMDGDLSSIETVRQSDLSQGEGDGGKTS